MAGKTANPKIEDQSQSKIDTVPTKDEQSAITSSALEQLQISAERPTKAPVEQKHNFFDDFSDHSPNKKYRYSLFFIFTLLVVGVFYLLKPSFESLIKPQSSLENYIPVSQEPKSMHLEINNPDDELFSFDKTINISGKTSAKSSIVVLNGDLNWGIDANDQGEFAKVIDLKPGVNQILIYAFDPQGNSKTESRTIYMSEEKI